MNEDAISRQDVLDYCMKNGLLETWDFVNNLPRADKVCGFCAYSDSQKMYWEGVGRGE